VLILATKADKLNTTAQRAAVLGVRKQLSGQFPLGAGNVAVQLFSATARIGVEEAEAAIAGWLGGSAAVAAD
jgi:GTP-binding protein